MLVINHQFNLNQANLNNKKLQQPLQASRNSASVIFQPKILNENFKSSVISSLSKQNNNDLRLVGRKSKCSYPSSSQKENMAFKTPKKITQNSIKTSIERQQQNQQSQGRLKKQTSPIEFRKILQQKANSPVNKVLKVESTFGQTTSKNLWNTQVGQQYLSYNNQVLRSNQQSPQARPKLQEAHSKSKERSKPQISKSSQKKIDEEKREQNYKKLQEFAKQYSPKGFDQPKILSIKQSRNNSNTSLKERVLKSNNKSSYFSQVQIDQAKENPIKQMQDQYLEQKKKAYQNLERKLQALNEATKSENEPSYKNSIADTQISYETSGHTSQTSIKQNHHKVTPIAIGSFHQYQSLRPFDIQKVDLRDIQDDSVYQSTLEECIIERDVRDKANLHNKPYSNGQAIIPFETYENVITKHTLNKVHWTQAARYAFNNHFNQDAWTVARVRHLDNDTVEIIKRKDQNKSICYKWGQDQRGIYERVVINRADKTVAIDRLDMNWKIDHPFMGRRDLFMVSKRGGDNATDFIRHEFWLHKLLKMQLVMCTHWCAWGYKRQFKKQQATN
ncbi:UNKNOWN [Stylonychia lemnae]|uniref:Uncharacterized protein n=1 Tax=Stylonychia lemnae TaxID=5949 RepID=A0A077ZWA1_STYLE|nr:UNKNOWN [Stylonychia lemnae]|eukprot:CDW73545.1 UNKNOWN [Stylonychia lemnae]